MKLLLENWRQYLNEAFTVENYYFIITPKQNSFRIEAMSEEMHPVISKAGDKDSFLSIEKRTGENNYEVAAANSPKGSKGVGLAMYKMAIELAGKEGLSPDSYDTSSDALRIWDIILADKEIEKKVKDPYDDEMNPLNNVYYDLKKNFIRSLGEKVIFKEPEKEKEVKPETVPEPFDVERDWENLYDDDIF